MTQYNQIFQDTKTREVKDSEENFAAITVFSPGDYGFPYLIKFEHGCNYNDDWPIQWMVSSEHLHDANVIRKAIKHLDGYKYQKTEVK